MIKYKALLENWKAKVKDGLEMDAIFEDYERLNNALWSMHDNGMIDIETLSKDQDKMNKALEVIKSLLCVVE